MYRKWKNLSETLNITDLLINRINHPTAEMHNLFADSLFDVILGGSFESKSGEESTMYQK